MQDVVDQVEKDVHRTVPKVPDKSCTGTDALRRVLLAYAKHRPAVGYCQVDTLFAYSLILKAVPSTDIGLLQGMNFLAGMFLQYLSEESSFWGLATLVDSILADYFVESMAGALVDQHICNALLQQFCPHIMRHADSLQVNISLLASQWLLTAFVNVLPIDTAMRIWDVMLFENSACILFRVLLAIVEGQQQELLSCKDSSELWQAVVSMPGRCDDPTVLLQNASLHRTTISQSVHPH